MAGVLVKVLPPVPDLPLVVLRALAGGTPAPRDWSAGEPGGMGLPVVWAGSSLAAGGGRFLYNGRAGYVSVNEQEVCNGESDSGD